MRNRALTVLRLLFLLFLFAIFGYLYLFDTQIVSADKNTYDEQSVLANFAQITCSDSYQFASTGLNADCVTNPAFSYSVGMNTPIHNGPENAIQAAALTIVKTANPTTYTAVNDVISYSYLVTNSGTVDFTGPVTVSDDNTNDEACPLGGLLIGEQMTCTASYTIKQPDINNGSVTNTAYASANGTNSLTDTKTVYKTALSIVKTATPATYSTVGDVISYSYLVTNSGYADLAGPVTVSDDKATDEACPAGGLVIGASMTCTASYTIVAGDITAGSVTNGASASANGTTSPTVTKTVYKGALSIVKTATPATYSAVGNVISYSYLVTNSGNAAFAGPVTVSDDKATVTCPGGGLAIGASMTCSASYTITADDITAGSVTNIAFASANGTTSPTDTETVYKGALTIVKTATPATYSAAGNVISYSYLVTNSGTVNFAGPVTVSDDKATNEACPAGGLAIGAQKTCTASYTIVTGDITAGFVTNIAFASANGTTSPTDTETVYKGALTIVKTATPATYSAVGNVISYSYLVTNSGLVTFTGPVTVSDDKATNEACPAGGLAIGISMTCTASYTIVTADMTAGSVTNIASASANGTTSPTDTETVYKTALSIVKTATPATYSAVGNVISYSYLVTNSGTVDFAGPVTVSDDKATNETCPAGGLAIGISMTCTASYTIVTGDITAGFVTNIASASANGTTSPTATKTVYKTALTIVKTATPATYSAVGNVISYSYLVTNSGTVDFAGPVTVSDDKATNETCPAGGLAIGLSMTCTASYTITAGDITAGSVTNIASASANGTTSPTATKTVYKGALTIVKTATPATYSAVGNVISYSYLVTNSGTVAFAGPVTVSDDKATNETCPAGGLAIGISMSCTASYTIVAGDITAGSVTNIASASANGTTSPTATKTVYKTALTIVKTATPATYSAVGNVISYSYLVTNSGNAALAGPVTVSDDKATNEACPSGGLAIGASMTCTASYTIVAGDITAGFVTNIASATANGTTSPSATKTVYKGALTIAKTANPKTYDAVGNVIGYSYLVTNSGTVALAGPVTVSDDKATNETCPPGGLAIGAQMTCIANYSITQADLNAGSVTNIASASADGTTSPTDTETVISINGPAITMVKTANPRTYNAVGNVIGYSYLVTNVGNVRLIGPVTIADDKAANEACPNLSTIGNADNYLDVGESITCTASYPITQADLNVGSITNIASASAGGTTSPTDTETVTAIQSPALTIIKTATPTIYDHEGQVISYSFKVQNTGNVTLSGPFSVFDDKTTNETCPPSPASLNPNDFVTCTASYSIMRTDMSSGSVTNAAYATGKFGGGTVTSPTVQKAIYASHTLSYIYLPVTYLSRPGVQILPASSYYESHGVLYIVGEVLNNTSNTLGSVKITVNFLDAGGQPVATPTYYPYLWPNDLPAFSRGCFKLRMDIPLNWSSFQFKAPDYLLSTTSSGLTIFGDTKSFNGGDYVISGKVRNNGTLLSKNVMLSATLYNATGVPVDCDRSAITDILPGATSDFLISFLGYYRDYSDVTQYKLRVAGELP